MCKKTHSEPSVRQTKKKNKRKAILEETDRGRSRGGAGFHGDRDAPSSCRLLSLFLDADRPPRPTPSLHAGSASQPSRNKYARGCSGKTASNQSFPDYLPLCGAIFFNPAPIALLSALFCLPSTLPYRSSPLCPSAPPNIPSGCVPTLFATPSFRFHPPYPPLCLPVLETTVPCTLFPACLSFLHVFFSLPPPPPACWGVLAISGTAMRRTSLVPSFSSLLRAESTSRQDFSGCEFPPRFPFRASLLLAGRLSRLRRAPALFRSPANFDCIDSRSLVRVRCELARPAVVLRRRSQAGGGCRRISFTFTQQRRYRWNGR